MSTELPWFPPVLMLTDDLGQETVILPPEAMRVAVDDYNEAMTYNHGKDMTALCASLGEWDLINPYPDEPVAQRMQFEEWELVDPTQGLYEGPSDSRAISNPAVMKWNHTGYTFEIDD